MYNMHPLIVIICLFSANILINSCNGNENYSKASKGDSTGIIEITIVNKTENKYLKKMDTIKDVKSIKKIWDEINVLKRAGEVNVNVNNGYFDIKIKFIGGSQKNISIIYTVYDGVVIAMDEGYYKNDRLEVYIYKKLVTEQ